MEAIITDFRVKITVKNNRILRAIEQRGFKSVMNFCRVANINYHLFSELILFKRSPLYTSGEWTQCAKQASLFLGIEESELWPDHIKRLKANKTATIFSTDEAGIRALSAPTTLSVNSKALNQLMDKARLSDRERAIIDARFGITTGDEQTFRALGETYHVNHERIRQIEAKAMRKIKSAVHRQHSDLSDYITQ